MRIYFCDLCNESVPQSDLDQDRAVLRKGRVVCANCEAAMSAGAREAETAVDAAETPARPVAVVAAAPVPAPPAPAPARSGSGAVVGVGLASVALILVMGTTVFLFDRMERQHVAVMDELGVQRDEIGRSARRFDARLDNRLGEVADDLGETGRQITELRVRVSEAAAYQRESVDGVRADLARLGERLGELERALSDVERHERELSKVADTVAGLHAEVLLLRDRMAEVRDAGERLAAAAAEPEAPVEEKPDWWPIVAELSSQNSGARWGAVQALGDTRDPAVAEYLAPMLQDPDIFVRMATARILGDLAAPIGIPALIDALEDREPSVREAAVVSLRAITGRNLRFDPTGKESERAKKVKAWREWWEKARDDLLGGAPAESLSRR